MPNHVDQDLFIEGNTESIKKFISFAASDEDIISADKFIPYPKEYKEKDLEVAKIREKCERTNNWEPYFNVRDGFNSGGYQWCIANWGTKWGMYDGVIKSSNLTKKMGRVTYNFKSAWSPTIKIIIAMSEQFPKLKFKLKYYECGMGFKGTFIIKNGYVLKNVEEPYKGQRGG